MPRRVTPAANAGGPAADAGGPAHRARTDRLGVVLTAALASAWFGFIVCGAFAPALMRQTMRPGGSITLSFVFGLSVILLGVVLTAVYVGYANRSSR